jgi:hypothetical protein
VVVVTEQEASHNAAALTERFVEALNYYAALFDCLEVVAARGSVERARVERWLLGEEIKNIVACDGAERRERHERLERWAARMERARRRRKGERGSERDRESWATAAWVLLGHGDVARADVDAKTR